MSILESYIAGTWQSGSGEGRPYHDAATGGVLGEVSSEGLDMAGALTYARGLGGPSIRDLTFHERAAMLKDVGKLLLSEPVKDTLYSLSTKTGATGKDSWIDVDGGASVLLTYSSKARKELPNATVARDGAPEVLARDGSFLGAHIYTPRTGVAVQINAFNFPVWGMLEKFAPTFLAGLPTIAKPASQTAFLTEAAVRIIVDSGILPEGSLQLISGSVGDLLDGLDGQDSVGFTGSASTARMLRAHRNLVDHAVRFTAEADSLNSAILTSAAAPGTPEFDAFVAEVVQEMTTKAGQKCTAIRRAFVPEQFVDEAIEAIDASLAEVVVGDPADPTVQMGLLASREQTTEVAKAVGLLNTCATTVRSSSEAVGVDPERAFFHPPTLLRADDRWAEALHDTEAFGPVATVIPYAGEVEAVALAALGGGSLVASVYGNDADEIASIVRGLAPQHGRIHVVDATTVESTTGHGSPLPHLVHGGPGRAGGGEELGGIRSVLHHMQRSALQGSPEMLTAITGEYMPGAPTSEAKGHPFKLTFDDLAVGDSLTTDSRVVTLEDIAHFADFTGDTFYAHVDEEAAGRSPIFGGLVAHGYLVLSFAAGLFVWPDEGPVLANYGIDRLRFSTPTSPGDELHVVLTCKRKTLMEGRGYGEVAWDTLVKNQRGEVAAAYDVLTMVANQPGTNGAADDS